MTRKELVEIKEDEIRRPNIDDLDEMEEYIRNYLEKEYGHKVRSFKFQFDMRNVYIDNIKWMPKG